MLADHSLDLTGILQMKTLLERPEAGATVLVQTDHFAINYDSLRQTMPQGSNDVRELEVLRRMMAAQEGEITAVETAKNAQPIVRGLKDPGWVVEWFGYERTEHGARVGRHGRWLKVLYQP